MIVKAFGYFVLFILMFFPSAEAKICTCSGSCTTQCCDGRCSTSSGSGTCSGHGGVCGYYSPCYTPNEPNSVTASDGEYTNMIRITWDSTLNTTSYKIYGKNESAYSYALIKTVYGDTGYDYETNNVAKMTIKVEACNSCGCSTGDTDIGYIMKQQNNQSENVSNTSVSSSSSSSATASDGWYDIKGYLYQFSTSPYDWIKYDHTSGTLAQFQGLGDDNTLIWEDIKIDFTFDETNEMLMIHDTASDYLNRLPEASSPNVLNINGYLCDVNNTELFITPNFQYVGRITGVDSSNRLQWQIIHSPKTPVYGQINHSSSMHQLFLRVKP